MNSRTSAFISSGRAGPDSTGKAPERPGAAARGSAGGRAGTAATTPFAFGGFAAGAPGLRRLLGFMFPLEEGRDRLPCGRRGDPRFRDDPGDERRGSDIEGRIHRGDPLGTVRTELHSVTSSPDLSSMGMPFPSGKERSKV